MSYQLATIKCDVELEKTAGELAASEPDIEALAELYQKFELKRLLADLGKGGTEASSTGATKATKVSKTSKSSSSTGEQAIEIKSVDVAESQYDIILDKALFENVDE